MLIPVINKLEVAKKSLSVTLQDTTGAYHASTNPGGYGTPNIASPPGSIGLIWRHWDSATPYSNFVSADNTLITELLTSTGHKFLAEDLGLSVFPDGVNHIKYYPFEPTIAATTAALTDGSNVITLTGTFDPTTLGDEYIAVILFDSGGALATKVLLLTDKDDWTSGTFIVDTTWAGTSGSSYTFQFATEADLKILIKGVTENCIAGKIGKIASMECCENKVVEKLTNLTMWMFAAEVKTQCADYTGANDLVLKALKECTYCISPDCLTCT